MLSRLPMSASASLDRRNQSRQPLPRTTSRSGPPAAMIGLLEWIVWVDLASVLIALGIWFIAALFDPTDESTDDD
jgi:cytoskeletal protein RodZ